MDAVLRGDEAVMRNPVLNDTVELARSLWPNCSARPARARKYYTVAPCHPAAQRAQAVTGVREV